MAAGLDTRLVQRASATRLFLVAVAVTGILNALLVIAQAWLIAVAVTGIFEARSTTFNGPFDSFAIYIVALLAIFILRGVLSWANSWFAHRSSAAVKSQLRTDIVKARLAQPSGESTSAELINLLTDGLDDLDAYFEKYLPQLLMAAVIPVIVVVVIWAQDVSSALILIVTLPLIPIFMILIGYTTQDAVAKRYSSLTRLANHFSDLISGLPTLQIFGRARAQLKGLETTETRFRVQTMNTLRIAFLSGGVLEILATLSVALVAVSIGLRVVGGDLTYTAALFILVLAPEAYLPIRQVGTHFHDSADGAAAARSAFDIIDAADEAVGGDIPAPSLTDATIRFEDVTVSFADNPPVLDELSFTLSPGQTLALVGPSGAGKSTALSVLLGFLRPDSGSVWVGDTNLNDIDPASWHRQISYVAQHPGMLRGSVSDNIRMGNQQASTAQQRDVLDRCGGAQLSLDRHVGDDGEGLSAGERRRVALARALLRIETGGASLLVMDEPTAGLDEGTELVAIEAVRATGASAIIISHRQAMLTLADTRLSVTGGDDDATS